MLIYLTRLTVWLPAAEIGFCQALAALLDGLGQHKNGVLSLTQSQPDFYPAIEIAFGAATSDVQVEFSLSNGDVHRVRTENSTGLHRESPHVYERLSVGAVAHRLSAAGVRLVSLDHAGLNLPWFASNVHPRIAQLRESLAGHCLYPRFPTGESWDFILPGDLDEIARRKPIDYSLVRRPKFELVSFEKSSTPLIQFDLGVSASYEALVRLFPEALNDAALGSVWVYLTSPYPIDVCIVLGAFDPQDWSAFFKGHRL